MRRTNADVAVILGTVLVCGAAVFSFAAEPPALEPVDARLVSSVRAIRPAAPFWVGVRMVMNDGWHVNWVNPGDAGLAPAVEWSLPDGFRAEPLEWPFPSRHELSGITIFGYEHEVTLLCRITPPDELNPGAEVPIRAAVSWLACREACVPGDANLSLSLPVSASGADEVDETWRGAIERSLSDVPAPPERWRFDAKAAVDRIVVVARPGQGRDRAPASATFFPFRQGIIENSAPQVWSREGSVYRLELRRDKLGGELPDSLEGVLVSEQGWENGRKAIELVVPLDGQR